VAITLPSRVIFQAVERTTSHLEPLPEGNGFEVGSSCFQWRVNHPEGRVARSIGRVMMRWGGVNIYHVGGSSSQQREEPRLLDHGLSSGQRQPEKGASLVELRISVALEVSHEGIHAGRALVLESTDIETVD